MTHPSIHTSPYAWTRYQLRMVLFTLVMRLAVWVLPMERCSPAILHALDLMLAAIKADAAQSTLEAKSKGRVS